MFLCNGLTFRCTTHLRRVGDIDQFACGGFRVSVARLVDELHGWPRLWRSLTCDDVEAMSISAPQNSVSVHRLTESAGADRCHALRISKSSRRVARDVRRNRHHATGQVGLPRFLKSGPRQGERRGGAFGNSLAP